MLNKTKVLLVFAFFILIFCFLLVFQSEQVTSNTVNAQTQSAQLSLEISKSQESYLKAEPISINLRLSNLTNQPISWRGVLNGGPDINFLVTNAAGVESRLDGSNTVHGFYYIPLRVMQPGEKVQESILLTSDLVQEFFPDSGGYNLQIKFVYDRNVQGEQRTKILSNSIPINILEPQGINRQAYQYIKQTLDPSRFQTNPRDKARLEQEFVDRYRNSVYAKYIIFNLANTYQAIGNDEKALRELCKIYGENFHYSKDVEKKVLRIDAKLRPVVWSPNAPIPTIIHPCTGRIMNPYNF